MMTHRNRLYQCSSVLFLLLWAGTSEAWACPSGSEILFRIPLRAATAMYGLCFLAIVGIECLLFKKFFQLTLRRAGLVALWAGVAGFVLNYALIAGVFLTWSLLLIVAGVLFSLYTVRLLYRDGLLGPHRKSQWLIMGAIVVASVVVITYVGSIGHQLEHRGAHGILGTYREYVLYYAGLFAYGVYTAIIFDALVVTRFVQDVKGIYGKLFATNTLSHAVVFFVYLMVK